MVKIGNIHNSSGGNVTINDMRTVQLPLELIERIQAFDAKHDAESPASAKEAKSIARDILSAVIVKTGTDKLSGILDKLLF